MDRRSFLMGLTLPGILADSVLGGSDRVAPLPQRTLGRTGLSVSLLGCGYTVLRDARFFRRAYELGINNFLLSPANLEACAAVRPFRHKVVANCILGAKDSEREMLADLDAFLLKSRLDHVEVWYIAVPTNEQFKPIAEAVLAARQTGKARFAAITTHRMAEDVPRLLAAGSVIDVVMIQYNSLSPASVHSDIARLHAAGVAMTPMKAGSGAFDREVIGAKGVHASVRWVASDTRISCIPLRMNSLEELEQDVRAISLPLTDKDREVLKQVNESASSRVCRMCGGCEGKCVNGLAVSDLVRCAMYVEGYRDHALAREQFAMVPAERRKISCHGCSQCVVTCPYGVNVRERVQVAQSALA